jgi:hypothetical protein
MGVNTGGRRRGCGRPDWRGKGNTDKHFRFESLQPASAGGYLAVHPEQPAEAGSPGRSMLNDHRLKPVVKITGNPATKILRNGSETSSRYQPEVQASEFPGIEKVNAQAHSLALRAGICA